MARERVDLSEVPPVAVQRFEDKYRSLDKWLNGSVWELHPRADFKVKADTFVQGMKTYAAKKGISVSTRLRKDGVVFVQAKKDAPVRKRTVGRKPARRKSRR